MAMPAPSAPAGAAAASAVPWALLAAMALWGLNVTVVKALTNAFEPMPLAALRMVVATLALSGFVAWRRCGIPVLSLRQWGAVAVCASLMVYLNQILFAQGLLRSTATNCALIMALSPLFSSLLAALVFRERLTPMRLVGVALGFAGVAAVVLSHSGSALSNAGLGDLMMVASVLAFAVGGVLVQRLARRLNPLSISWAIYAMGTVMLVAHTLLDDSDLSAAALMPGAWPWALVLFSGVLATAVGNLIWNRAIATVGVARTALFLYWVPIFGIGFAALFLGERVTWWHLVGFVAVMGGTYLGTRAPTRAAPIDAT